MNHLHWMKLYIGDELSNTSHMTPAEIGSYMLLKMHYWRFGCLPADDERLARIAKVSAEVWEAIKPSIGPLFGDGWRDEKLEAQRDEAEEKHKARVEAGRKGGKVRKQSSSNAYSKSQAKWKQPEPEPEPDPYSDPASDPGSDPEGSALDNEGEGNAYTRPFPKPKSIDEGTNFLFSRGCPPEDMKRCLGMLMEGHLTRYDIEPWDIQARATA